MSLIVEWQLALLLCSKHSFRPQAAPSGEILLQVNLCTTFSETGEHLVDVNKYEALVCLHCVSGLGSYNMSQSKCELAGISTK